VRGISASGNLRAKVSRRASFVRTPRAPGRPVESADARRGGRAGAWGRGHCGPMCPRPRDHVLLAPRSQLLAEPGQGEACRRGAGRADPGRWGALTLASGGEAQPVVMLTHKAASIPAYGAPFADQRVPLQRDTESSRASREGDGSVSDLGVLLPPAPHLASCSSIGRPARPSRMGLRAARDSPAVASAGWTAHT